MNFHYYGETHLILDIIPNEYPTVPLDKNLFKVVIEDESNCDTTVKIWHHTYTYYGNRAVVWHGTVPKGNL